MDRTHWTTQISYRVFTCNKTQQIYTSDTWITTHPDLAKTWMQRLNPQFRMLSLTTSSIFRMLRTVSVARVSALMETSKGCTTSSSRMLEIPPCHTHTVNQSVKPVLILGAVWCCQLMLQEANLVISLLYYHLTSLKVHITLLTLALIIFTIKKINKVWSVKCLLQYINIW